MTKRAFTLAEVLITLAVIGVVAALTIPSLMQQIGDYTLQKQKDVFSKKWAEGLRQMRVDGKLGTQYASTADFVNEMKNYFKISNVCDSNNLTNCFTEKITSYENSAEGEEFEVKDLKSAKNFNKSEEDSDVYGIRYADGTSMLLAYKKDCVGISEGDTRGNHTACLLYVYDVNANKSPNAYGGNTGADSNKKDDEISTINKGRDLVGNVSITKGNAFGLDFEIINNTAYAMNTCASDNVCFNTFVFDEENGFSNNWQGAVNFCEALNGNLPSEAQLQAIAEKIYPCANLQCSPDTSSGLWAAIGGLQGYAALWSNDEGEGGYGTYGVFGSLDGFYTSDDGNNDNVWVLCVK